MTTSIISTSAKTEVNSNTYKEYSREQYKLEIQAQAEIIARSYVRIAGTWYKKCIHPVTNQPVREHVRAEDLIKDYGKDLGPAILNAAPKCINYVNVPDHLNYQEFVGSMTQDSYYNLYRPISYFPKNNGDFKHIDTLIHHIFGEQYEMGLDYVQLLYLHPMKRLPVLVLVSRENGTGKSTFCNFLHEIFGDNCSQITNDELRSNFNSTWVSKLLVFCEETLLDRREDSEKIKNLTTALTVSSEAKGKDRTTLPNFIKFILCSNDEDRPIIINADDTRHWIRKVPHIENRNSNENFLEECKKEIPAFLYHLSNRRLTTKGTDRLWFRPEETRTEAWRRIVAGGMTALTKEIAAILLRIMDTYKLQEIKYDAESLYQLVVAMGIPYTLKCQCSRIIVRDSLKNWGLKASTTTCRFDYYVMQPDGKTKLEGTKTGKAFSIPRSLIESIIS